MRIPTFPWMLGSAIAISVLTACGGTTSSTGGTGNAGGSGNAAGGNGGTTPTGVGPQGGTVESLLFAVVGDTRPPTADDISAYPTQVIQTIYADIAAMNPAPDFVLSTGDHMYANPYGGQASQQLDIYLKARAQFSGQLFPAMGNHECTGGTSSNCSGSYQTDNFKQFISMMLGPLSVNLPYYVINVNAADNSWTAKFVFTAANAWDSTQASWLQTTLAVKTTYTFVIRHESASVSETPGVDPSEQIINSNPYTLEINGHTHSYEHRQGSKSLIIGNGGAPLSGGVNFGYGVFSQRQDGAIVVDMMDYQTNKPDPSFHFVVKADGTETQ
jgi:Calcineurin-like phosphoesterase